MRIMPINLQYLAKVWGRISMDEYIPNSGRERRTLGYSETT
jgi:hypothetical protein